MQLLEKRNFTTNLSTLVDTVAWYLDRKLAGKVADFCQAIFKEVRIFIG